MIVINILDTILENPITAKEQQKKQRKNEENKKYYVKHKNKVIDQYKEKRNKKKELKRLIQIFLENLSDDTLIGTTTSIKIKNNTYKVVYSITKL